MLKNYLAIALRSMRRHLGYTALNVFGLAAGLAAFILILLFVQHELSYDRFYEDSDRIFRVVKRHPGVNFHGLDSWAVTPAPLASTLVEEIPEIRDATTIGERSALLSVGNQHFWEEGLSADENFFDVFSSRLLHGNSETALVSPNGIVLTETLARRLFGDRDAMGQTLLYQRRDPYTVTGVIPDVPANSSIKYSFIISIRSQSDYAENLARGNWDSANYYTFFRAAEGATETQLQARMPDLVEKYAAREGDNPAWRVQFLVQALRDMHLHSRFNVEIASTGNATYVYLFLAVGFVILLLACVNYTNLAVARSIKRAREVGLRKVVGAWRRQLIAQFLGESVLMAFLALVLALGLVHLLLPYFGNLVERPIHMDYFGNGLLVPGLSALVLIVGLLSGSYPALFMASLRPIEVLTGTREGRSNRFRVQRLLIVGQYAVSVALVAGSFVVYQQMQYVRNKDLGYDREHVLTVRVKDEALRTNYRTMRNEWLRIPGVLAVTSSSDLPTNVVASNGIGGLAESSAVEDLQVYMTYAGYDYLDVFGMELAAGRSFSREISSDTLGAALINETTARSLGWTPEEAVGKTFVHNNGERTIVGVVNDFHMHSMHMPIEPLVIRFNTGGFGYISAKIRSDDLPATISSLAQTANQFTPYPFEYQFLDRQFDQIYSADLRMGETFGFFTILALLIASLGLFGLAAFAAEQRTKEIGIRKVLGADVSGLVALLSKDFLKLVGIAFIIGAPIAYFAMQRWLESFAYRIDISPAVFVVAGLAVSLVALLAVSYQSIKAALVDPVTSLRSE